jgi:hypothetical protein
VKIYHFYYGLYYWCIMRNLNFSLLNIADAAHGALDFAGPHDEWRIDRTRQWCSLYTTGEWRYRIDMAGGVIRFDFALQKDADAFRQATNMSPTLIACR